MTWRGWPLVHGANQTGPDVQCDGFVAGSVVKEGSLVEFFMQEPFCAYVVREDCVADGFGNMELRFDRELERLSVDNEQMLINGLRNVR